MSQRGCEGQVLGEQGRACLSQDTERSVVVPAGGRALCPRLLALRPAYRWCKAKEQAGCGGDGYGGRAAVGV